MITVVKEIIKEFSHQRILNRGGIRYLDLPFFNHSKATNPRVLKQLVAIIISQINWSGVTKIVSEEEYGGFLAACVGMEKGIPFTLAKQNKIHAINGIGITFSMAYNTHMNLYLNGVEKNDKVVIIDDIIDTGGTIIALIKALKKKRVAIAAILAVAERISAHGTERIKQETGYTVITLLQLDDSGNTTKVVGTYLDKKV